MQTQVGLPITTAVRKSRQVIRADKRPKVQILNLNSAPTSNQYTSRTAVPPLTKSGPLKPPGPI